MNLGSRCQSFEFDVRSNVKRPNQASISDYDNDEHNLNRYVYSLEEKAKIVNWLKTGFTSIQLP